MSLPYAGPLRNGSPTDSTTAWSSQFDSQVADALEEYCRLVRAGHGPGRSEFLARHGEIARQLQEGAKIIITLIYTGNIEYS